MYNIDLDKLADILDINRDVLISESHWKNIRNAIERNHHRFAKEEKLLQLQSYKNLNKSFSI